MCQFSDVNLLWCVEIDICNVQYFFFQKKKVQKCVRHNEYLKAISFGQWEGHKGCQSSLQWECGKQWLYNNVAVHEWFYCLCGHKWIVVMLPKKERGGGNNLFTMCLKILRTVLSMQFFFLFFISIGKTLGAEKKNAKVVSTKGRTHACCAIAYRRNPGKLVLALSWHGLNAHGTAFILHPSARVLKFPQMPSTQLMLPT